MKKALLSVLCIGMLFFLCTPAGALPYKLVEDQDILTRPLTDVNAAYWSGSDTNTLAGFSLLSGAKGDAGVLVWLKALLGQTPEYNDPNKTPSLIAQMQWSADDKQVTINPGFQWQYAVVKFGNLFIALENDNNFILTTPKFQRGVSNIRFYGVSEPSTMLLLGFGLIGLAAFGRKRFFRRA